MATKTEVLNLLRYFRPLLKAWLESLDKELLALVASEIGQYKRVIEEKLKNT